MGGHSSSESQSYVGMEIYVNGSRYNGAWFNQGSGYSVAERTWTLKLSDGDYVEMGYELSNNNGGRDFKILSFAFSAISVFKSRSTTGILALHK